MIVFTYMNTTSISQLKVNPSAIISMAADYPVAVENRNKVQAYVIGKLLYEKMIAMLEDKIDRQAIADADFSKGKDFETVAKKSWTMKIVISPRAEKQFRKLQKFDQIAITQKIRSRLESISNEEKLSGYKDIYRVRVGNYRIIYRRGNFAYIILIGHRKEVYRLLKDVLR